MVNNHLHQSATPIFIEVGQRIAASGQYDAVGNVLCVANEPALGRTATKTNMTDNRKHVFHPLFYYSHADSKG